MLRQVLAEIENAPGAVRLGDIADRVGLERSVVADMVGYWVRRGRLVVDDGSACASGGPKGCAGCSMDALCGSPLRLLVPRPRPDLQS